MSLLQPSMLWFLALVPVVVLFYILRAQHRQQSVSSVLFWQHVSSDLEGRPTRRLPLWSLLLLLQLLVVLALVFALGRPSIMGGTKRHLILVLDAAVSMQATDVSPSRFEAAKTRAGGMIDAMTSGDQVTLIRAAQTPSILETANGEDKKLAKSALASAVPSGGPSDMYSALALATSLAGQTRETHNEVVVLSDGDFPKVDLAKLGSPPADIRLEPIGSSSRNVAITELSVRPVIGTVGRYAAFVRVTNFGDVAVTAPLKTTADGIPFESQTIDLPATGAVELTINLPNGTKYFEIKLDAPDYLAIDNQAQAVVGDERQLQVTLVTANVSFWDKTLSAFPLMKITRVRPQSYKPVQADLVIFDSFTPPVSQWPNANMLLVNPGAGTSGDLTLYPIQPSGEAGPAPVVSVDGAAPLLRGVDLTSVILPKVARIQLPSWAQPVAETNVGPLISEGEYAGRKIVVYSFDPSASDLPQLIAFPFRFADTVAWLAPANLPTDVKPDSVVEINPAADAKDVIVRLPNGKAQAFPARGRAISFAQTDSIGRYVITQRGDEGVLDQHAFTVNVTDVTASDITPRPDALGAGYRGPTLDVPGVVQELWPFLAVIAIILLGGEWWYYSTRRA